MNFTAGDAAEWTGGTCQGSPLVSFSGIESLEHAQSGHLTMVANKRFAKTFENSPASGALCTAGIPLSRRPDQAVIEVPDADLAMVRLLEKLSPPHDFPPIGRHPSAVVAPDARISPTARIGPCCVIASGVQIGDRTILEAHNFVGRDSVIGDDCILYAQAVVRPRCTLGHRVIIHSGAVIGADGFGYVFSDGRHIKIPHIGAVLIEEDCELGANACVDRGKYSQTTIGAGSKLDNLVQVGHNVRLGRHTILVSHVAIGGSVIAGDYLAIGGGSVVTDHAKLGAGTQVAGFSAVFEDAAAGSRIAGAPGRPARQFFAELRAIMRLPATLQSIRELQERVTKIESTTEDHRT